MVVEQESVVDTSERDSRRVPGKIFAYILIFIATLSWGANMVVAKVALREFSPFVIGPLRIFWAGIIFCLLGVRVFRRRGNLYRRDGKMLFGLAVVGPVMTHLFFVTGMNLSSPFHAGLIYALGPVLVLLMASRLGMEPLTMAKITGATVAFGGVAMLGSGEPPLQQENVWIGDLLLFCGASSFSIYTILAKRAAAKYDTMTLNAFTYLIAAVLVVPFLVMTLPGARLQDVSAVGWAAAGFVLLFGAIIPYLLYYKALARLTAGRVAFFSYLEPLIAGGGSALLLHEAITLRMILAAVLILGGVYLAERGR